MVDFSLGKPTIFDKKKQVISYNWACTTKKKNKVPKDPVDST